MREKQQKPRNVFRRNRLKKKKKKRNRLTKLVTLSHLALDYKLFPSISSSPETQSLGELSSAVHLETGL